MELERRVSIRGPVAYMCMCTAVFSNVHTLTVSSRIVSAMQHGTYPWKVRPRQGQQFLPRRQCTCRTDHALDKIDVARRTRVFYSKIMDPSYYIPNIPPPIPPPPCLPAASLCIFSDTFMFTSKNLATHRSMQTLSALFRSGSL